ncbi:DUF2491 domain-containing protein [Caulobacter flavus]|uniref:DUF2491 domain-containing protein n=1 Tax=Caulobacter flavus TaxID=1679497 RepID=A0A2N5CPE1_9CAUL|nr:DUF2491 family protein [Caulobacter flavus]AYV48486.1 DUF2491 domain-containing protein [Caulobacter flavus]PLR08798.1 DUF2491 domain-containing protein [Caulobacter flavus]
MFSRLFGRKEPAPESALPAIRNVTLGRTVWLDPLAWKRFGSDTKFPLDRDTLEITAQGLVDLKDGGFVHRFYTDDHVMFQAVSDDRAGQRLTDVTIFVPWDSAYPGGRADRDAWGKRLRARSFTPAGLPEYHRFWFGDEAESQDPVTFWEELHDDRDGVPDRKIFQTCMLFARDLPGEGRELLLAIEMETEDREVSFETMIGVPLEVGEFRA